MLSLNLEALDICASLMSPCRYEPCNGQGCYGVSADMPSLQAKGIQLCPPQSFYSMSWMNSSGLPGPVPSKGTLQQPQSEVKSSQGDSKVGWEDGVSAVFSPNLVFMLGGELTGFILLYVIIYIAYVLWIMRPSRPFSEWIKDCINFFFF